MQPRDDKDTPGKSVTKDQRVKQQKDSSHSSILEEKLRVSEQRYRDLFERVRHGLFLSTKEGRFIDCNPAMFDVLGYASKEEFLSVDIERDLYVNPEDRERFQREIEEKGYVKDYEINFRKKNGEIISGLVTCNTLFDKKGRDGRLPGFKYRHHWSEANGKRASRGKSIPFQNDRKLFKLYCCNRYER